jgi:transglutaminase-like putative cysteine protease
METVDMETVEDLDAFLRPGQSVDSDSPDVLEFVRRARVRPGGGIDAAVRLYYAVRDGIRYDPYCAVLTPEGLSGTRTVQTGRGWCVTKAILLVAACRGVGIPARLGFADVRNHLATARLRERMATEVFYWHGYAVLHLEGHWVKATPAFNIEMCEKFGLLPLEFDGREDSLYQPFDVEGNRHMEYLRDRGQFAEPPLDAMLATFNQQYRGDAVRAEDAPWGGDFERELEEEARATRRARTPSGE